MKGLVVYWNEEGGGVSEGFGGLLEWLKCCLEYLITSASYPNLCCTSEKILSTNIQCEHGIQIKLKQVLRGGSVRAQLVY